jgi:hypothetical protein
VVAAQLAARAGDERRVPRDRGLLSVTTLCQDIVNRARAFSLLNPSLTTDTAEMLSRIRTDQRELCTMVAAASRDFFQTVATPKSSAAPQNRVVDLAALELPVERILKVELPGGGEVSQVDILDPDAELAPRYTVRGYQLVEWLKEWDTATNGQVTLTVTYVYAPTDILATGTLAQPVSIPDEWTDLLVLPLAAYLCHKDVGREESEYQRIVAMLAAKQAAFLEFLGHYGGVEARRFDLPKPIGTKK